jgi:hypothetical protein
MYIRIKVYMGVPFSAHTIHDTIVETDDESLSDKEIISRYYDKFYYADYSHEFLEFSEGQNSFLENNSFFDTVKWERFNYSIERNAVILKI